MSSIPLNNISIERKMFQKRIHLQNEIADDGSADTITIKLKDMKFPLMTCPVKYYVDGKNVPSHTHLQEMCNMRPYKYLH